MKIWIISDTHFGHDGMIEQCGRPKDFNERIINALERTIGFEDVLIHFGDVSFYDHGIWHNMLAGYVPGKHWLIRGNHDKKSPTWYMTHGWDCVTDRIDLHVFGKRIALTHKPLHPSAMDEIDINVHGHHHNTLHHPEDETTEKHVLFVLEHHYSPILLRTLIKA